jgi:hypothetical protein
MQIAGIEGDAVTQKYLRLAKKVSRSLARSLALSTISRTSSLSFLFSLSFFSRSLSPLSHVPALSLSSLARSLTCARALSLS